mmetsp:Transcript_23826/g.34942  ORF Transcript_23826/g.34942 Transcript_23826/m.34942 type:complete len:174 (-) Transcript_23826:134-655(-)
MQRTVNNEDILLDMFSARNGNDAFRRSNKPSQSHKPMKTIYEVEDAADEQKKVTKHTRRLTFSGIRTSPPQFLSTLPRSKSERNGRDRVLGRMVNKTVGGLYRHDDPDTDTRTCGHGVERQSHIGSTVVNNLDPQKKRNRRSSVRQRIRRISGRDQLLRRMFSGARVVPILRE